MASKDKSMKYGRNVDSNYRMDSGYAGMISEDRSAPANLPQEKKMSYYKKCPYLDSDLDDSVVEVDKNADRNVRKLKETASDTMY